MSKKHVLAAIRDCLAGIYQDDHDSRRVCVDAGLRPETINFETSSLNRWFNIIEKARQTNKFDLLIEVCINDSGSQKLKDIYEKYLETDDNSDYTDFPEKKWRNPKFVLGIIDILIIFVFLLLLTQQYYSIKKYENIKFEKTKFECLTENCETVRERWLIFVLGEKTREKVSINLYLRNPDYQLIPSSTSVKQFEKSLFLSNTPSEAKGSEIDFQDPEHNRANTFAFMLNELSPQWIYELKFDVKSKGDKDFNNYANFEIRDAVGNVYRDSGMIIYDYLRLYLTEAYIICIFFALILGLLIWFIGKTFFDTRW